MNLDENYQQAAEAAHQDAQRAHQAAEQESEHARRFAEQARHLYQQTPTYAGLPRLDRDDQFISQMMATMDYPEIHDEYLLQTVIMPLHEDYSDMFDLRREEVS